MKLLRGKFASLVGRMGGVRLAVNVGEIRLAAMLGSPSQQYRLGARYYYGVDVAQDMSKAVAWFGKAADQGHRDAHYGLGYSYHVGGQDSPCDHEKALEWYRNRT